MAELTAKNKAWALFDRIVADAEASAASNAEQAGPWQSVDSRATYSPDLATLELLLGVPLKLDATVRSGIRALALDVWLSYEFRRAGFGRDQVWPRPTHPRILPLSVSHLLEALTKKERAAIEPKLLKQASVKNVTSSSASILGRNYNKQVDVIMTDWATGPELLISTKRMDSSYGKNAPNRIEESYGDAKNLRLRHPMAALGFLMAVRSDIQSESRTLDWLADQIGKLGQADDAYHNTCLVVMEYGAELGDEDPAAEASDEVLRPAGADEGESEEELPDLEGFDVDAELAALPSVRVREGLIEDPALSPTIFLGGLISRILDSTPITMHEEARRLRKQALKP